MLRELAHYSLWFAKCKLLGKRIPLELVLNITSRCNLQCIHCSVRHSYKPMDVSYLRVTEALDYSYEMGSRVLWFGGGEPVLWQGMDNESNKYGIEDLIKAAKQRGYYRVILITNGTLPIETSADAVWVSIDGVREGHDAIRGRGSFDITTRNVRESSHKNMYANMSINAVNYKDVEDVVKMVPEKGFKSISFSFHTPFRGTEKLFLPRNRRDEVIEKIIKLKMEGFPVVNSVSGMKRMKEIDWSGKCAYWAAAFLEPDGSIIDGCPGKYEENVCQRCGFGMGRELSNIFSLNPSSAIEALRLVLTREI